MPALAEAPAETEINPFAEFVPDNLIGGDSGAPAYQVVAGKFSEVPRAEVNTPTDLGAFADLVPPDAPSAGSMDFGQFTDLVPVSPTSEAEKALAETPSVQQRRDEAAFKTSPLINAEKGVEAMTGVPIHQAINAVRSFGALAGTYIFEGLQALELNQAKILAHKATLRTDEVKPNFWMPLQGDEFVLPDGSAMSKEQVDALEQHYVKKAQTGVPEAMARSEYFKTRAAGYEAFSGVDPELKDTIPARLARTAGQAAVMAMEALIPGVGLPLMVAHGALATEAQARNAGKSPEEAEAAAVRSAIGLAIFGGASKLAALGVAKLLPQGAEKLTKFIAQFTGQAGANETSSRAIAAWEAAAEAPEGQKVQAAMEAMKATTLEATTLNTVYALMHASRAAGQRAPVRPASAPERVAAPERGPSTETARYAEPAQPVVARESTADVVPPGETRTPSSADTAPVRQPTVPISETARVAEIPVETLRSSNPQPKPTTPAAANARATEANLPEHLRRNPEIDRLINEPSAQTGPQMKLAPATQGGALGFGGGKRATTVPKGATPLGDTEFLRIEPGWKRIPKGLERKGAADVIGETKNKVGKLLSEATTRHVDTEQELHGQLSGEILRATKGTTKAATEKGFDEVAVYLAAKENGRPLPALSPTATKLVTAWENIAEQTGQIAAANNVQVFDPTTGAHRPMHVMGRKYVPRMMKPEVERAMRDPDASPKVWNDLVDAFAKQRGISDVEAAKALRAEAGRFSSSDFMGNLEMARTGKLPEIFYDYDLRNLAARYIPSFSERMAQIIAYGQRLGPRENPQRPNLWDVARKEAANDFTQRWLNNAEDQASNVRAKTASGVGMARAQTAASGLLLSSPTTTVVRNLLSGMSATPELLGARRSIKALAQTARNSQVRMDAREIGVVRDNIGDFLHADRLGDSFVDNAIRATVDAGLKYSGYNGSEVFVRSHGALTASQFAKDAVAAINKRAESMQSKEALGLFRRLGVNAEKIVAENADWKSGPETRKFIRTVVRETQGGYRFDQVPLWANSNMGRFFYQFGRWGTQRARNIWKNGVKPALGEEVQWKGKTMTRRDVRPLLKMLGATVVLGETFGGIAQILFGRDRRDASLSEISGAWDEDKKTAVALAMERVVNDVIMAGTLGIWSQPVDWARSLQGQTRLKNPFEPPGLGSLNAFADLGRAAIDQNGDVTRRDLMKFASSAVPGVKQMTDVARNVLDEPLYEAENDVRTLRAAAQRWGKTSGLDVSPRSRGSFRKSEMAPEYEPIKEALLVGDVNHASFLTKTFLDQQPNREQATKNLRASVKMSQPFRAGPYTAKAHRDNFRVWARQNLSDKDLEQTERIQERYVKAAVRAGLW